MEPCDDGDNRAGFGGWHRAAPGLQKGEEDGEKGDRRGPRGHNASRTIRLSCPGNQPRALHRRAQSPPEVCVHQHNQQGDWGEDADYRPKRDTMKMDGWLPASTHSGSTGAVDDTRLGSKCHVGTGRPEASAGPTTLSPWGVVISRTCCRARMTPMYVWPRLVRA